MTMFVLYGVLNFNKMKISLLTFFFLVVTLSFSQWNTQVGANQIRYSSVELINDSSFFSTSNYVSITQDTVIGRLYYSDNFGDSYSIIKEGEDDIYYDIKSFNDKLYLCGISGFGGYIGLSNDWGMTWKEVYTEEFGNWRSIFFVNDSVGFVGGGEAQTTIMKTVDGGSSWNVVLNKVGFEVPVSDLYFINDLIGFATTGGTLSKGKVYKTTNGGDSWEDITISQETGYSSIFFTDSNRGFLTTGDGKILRSIDLGERWVEVYPRGSFGEVVLEDVVFANEVVGYAVGLYVTSSALKKVILRTTDGGSNWYFIYNELASSFGLTSIDVTDNFAIVANGYNTHVFSSDGGGLNPISTVFFNGNQKLCDGDSASINFDFTGTAPFNVEYRFYTNGSIETRKLEGINQYSYTDKINSDKLSNISTSISINSFSDSKGISNNIAGSGVVSKDSRPEATISGGGIVCSELDSIEIKINILGCPPFNIVTFDGVSYDTLRDVETSDYRYRYSTSVTKTITLVEIVDVNGVVSSKSGLKGHAEVVSAIPNIVLNTSVLEACPFNEIDINGKLVNGSIPFKLIYSFGTKIDTVFISDSIFSFPISSLKNELLKVEKVNNSCGTYNIDTTSLFLEVSSFVQPPSDLIIENKFNRTILSWGDKSDNEVAFKIYRFDTVQKIENPGFKLVLNVDSNEMSGTDWPPKNYNPYLYTVCAVNESFCEICSDTVLFEKIPFFEVSDTVFGANISFGDFNNDLLDDVVTSGSLNSNNLLFYKNLGDGKFDTIPSTFVSYMEGVKFSDATIGDLNNDGYLDVFVGRYSTRIGSVNHISEVHQVYYGAPNFSFSVDSSTFKEYPVPTFMVNFVDLNNDGFLDVYVSSDSINQFFNNSGANKFELLKIPELEYKVHRTYHPLWSDLDLDGDMDFLLGTQAGGGNKDVFLRNGGNYTFTDFSSIHRYNSYGFASFDMDNDKDLDLVWGYTNGVSLIDNVDGELFTGETEIIHLPSSNTAKDVNIGDFDNDGFVDILHNRYLYLNNKDKTFKPVFLSELFQPTNANVAVAVADIDLDGDLDIVGKGLVHLNNLGNRKNWIKFKLEGTVSNTSAIGAKIFVKAKVNGESQWQMREVVAKTYYKVQNSLTQHFGLDNATTADSVIIQWTSGKVDTLTNIVGNTYYHLREDFVINKQLTSIKNLQSTKVSANKVLLSWTSDTSPFIGQLYFLERSNDSIFNNIDTIIQLDYSDDNYMDSLVDDNELLFYYRVKTVLESNIYVSNQIKVNLVSYCENATSELFLTDSIKGCDQLLLAIDDSYKSYLWSTGSAKPYVFINQSGLVSLEVITQNKCLFQDSIFVIIDKLKNYTLGEDTSICPGSSFNIYSNENNMFGVTWYKNNIPFSNDDSTTVYEEGVYYLGVSNGVCNLFTDPFELSINPYPKNELRKLFVDSILCQSKTYSIGSSSYANTFKKWFRNGVYYSDERGSLSVIEDGEYYFVATIDYGDGCVLIDTSNSIDIDIFEYELSYSQNSDTLSYVTNLEYFGIMRLGEIIKSENNKLVMPYSGTYRVLVQFENGCNDYQYVKFCIKPELELIQNKTIKISNVDPGIDSYIWYRDSTKIKLNADSLVQQEFMEEGLYYVKALKNDLSECETISDSVLIATVGINSLVNKDLRVRVFPNPISNEEVLTIETDENINQISVFDQSGRKVMSKNNLYNSKTFIIDFKLSSGIYLLIGETDKGLFKSLFSVVD